MVKASRLERFKALRQMQQMSGGHESVSSATAGGNATSGVPSSGGASSPVAGSKSQSPPASRKAAETQGPLFLLSTGGSESRDLKQPQPRRLGGGSADAAPQEAAKAAAQAVAMLAAQAAKHARAGKTVDGEKPPGESEGPPGKEDATLPPELNGVASSDKTERAAAALKQEETQRRLEDQVPGVETKYAGDQGDQQAKLRDLKMSKAKAKKHQQLLLLRTLEHKTAAAQTKADDPLDAFMTALESEAKEEVRTVPVVSAAPEVLTRCDCMQSFAALPYT